MNGKFVLATDVEREQLDWGELGWVSRPAIGAKQIVEIEVTLQPGCGHNFHKHPVQEEVIYIISGEVEQWLEDKKQILKPGDAIFIAAGVVHASFTLGDKPAKLIAVLSPCIGEGGYEMVEVSSEAPWNGLR